MNRITKKIVALAATLTVISSMGCMRASAFSNVDEPTIQKDRPEDFERRIFNVHDVKFFSSNPISSLLALRHSVINVSFHASYRYNSLQDIKCTLQLRVNNITVAENSIKDCVDKTGKNLNVNLVVPNSLSEDELYNAQLVLIVPGTDIDMTSSNHYYKLIDLVDGNLFVIPEIRNEQSPWNVGQDGIITTTEDNYLIVNNNRYDKTVHITITADKPINVKLDKNEIVSGTEISKIIEVRNAWKYPIKISGEKGCKYRIYITGMWGNVFYFSAEDMIHLDKNVRYIDYHEDRDTLSFSVPESGSYKISIMSKDNKEKFNFITLLENRVNDSKTNQLWYCFQCTEAYPTVYLEKNTLYQLGIAGYNPTEYYVNITEDK